MVQYDTIQFNTEYDDSTQENAPQRKIHNKTLLKATLIILWHTIAYTYLSCYAEKYENISIEAI